GLGVPAETPVTASGGHGSRLPLGSRSISPRASPSELLSPLPRRPPQQRAERRPRDARSARRRADRSVLSQQLSRPLRVRAVAPSPLDFRRELQVARLDDLP